MPKGGHAPSRLGALLADEAFYRQNGGDINGALKLARLAVQQFEQAERVTDWAKNTRARAYALLATYLTSAGQVDEAMEVWEVLLAERITYRADQYFLSGQIDRAYFQLLAGQESAPLFATVYDALAELEERRDLGRVLKEYGTLARMHSHQGRHKEALAILGTAVTRARDVEHKTPLARLLVVRADVLLADSQYGRLEEDLAEALRYFRANGLLRDEVAAFAIYGSYLAETKQYGRAASFIVSADFLARKFKGTDDANRLLDAIAALRNLPTELGHETNLDLQPIEMSTHVTSGELARGRFLLINLGDEPVTGALTVTGPVEADAWNPARKIWAIGIGNQSDRESISREFTLVPGEKVVIFTESASATREQQTVKLHWSGPPEMSAWWQFSSSGSAAEVAVVNANLALESPFYAVPLYHEIYYRGEKTNHLQNLRVKTSVPSRVVMSDEMADKILAIDAQGDGNFRGVGDVLFHDDDSNGFPDLEIEAEVGLATLELLIFPLERPSETDSISIEIEILNAEGQWENQEENILILNRPSSGR